MLDNIKEVFNMPIEEDKMDNITETSQKQLQNIAKGVKGKRVENLKNAQDEYNNFMSNFPTNPKALNPETIDQLTKKALVLDNNLANATKKVEHVNKVLNESDINAIVEEVINEVSNEWVKNKLKNVSKAEMDKRIKEREATAQAYNQSADRTLGPDKSGLGEKSRQKAESETMKAERLKDIKKVAKPSIMDKAKEAIGNFKKSGAEATKSVIDRAKEAIKNVGDSKVKDAGKAIKDEGKGVVDAVKQGVKDTIKGTVKGEDTHSASKSAIDRAKEVVKKQEARKAESDKDKDERAKNLVKQAQEKAERKADMQSRIEKAKQELEAQKKAKEEENKEPAKTDDNKEVKAEDTSKDDTKKDDEVKAEDTSKDDVKKDDDTKKDDKEEVKAEDTSKDDNKEGSKKVVKTSSVKSDATKANNVNAINNATINGADGKGNININQTANASRQGSKKTEESEESTQKAGEGENKPKLVKKSKVNKTEETPAPTKETTPEPVKAEGEEDKKGEDKPQEVKAEDNKPAEEEKNDKLKGIKVPTKFEKMSDDELRKELKRRQDVVLKANNAKLNPEIDSESALKKLSREDLLHAMFHKDSVKLYKEAEKKLTDASKNAPAPSKESTPETPNVEGDNKSQEVKAEVGNNETAKTTREQTPAGDKDKTSTDNKVEKIRGKKNNTTEGEKGELTPSEAKYMRELDPQFKANLAKSFQEKNGRKANGRELFDYIQKHNNSAFEREMKNKSEAAEAKAKADAEKKAEADNANNEATKVLADMKKDGFNVDQISSENEGVSPSELLKKVVREGDNQIQTLNNTINSLTGDFGDELKNAVLSKPEVIKNKLEELKKNKVDRNIIKDFSNAKLLELVDAIIEKNKLAEKLKKYKK